MEERNESNEDPDLESENEAESSDSDGSMDGEEDGGVDGEAVEGAEESDGDGGSGSGGESESSEGDKSDDSMDGTLDKCPVCLRVLKSQEIAVPDCCEHVYCLTCILEWAATASTCPIDRKPFHSVLIMDEVKGKIIRVQELAGRVSEINGDWDEFSDPTFCEVCGNCDREDRLLLCDGCDLGYHLECLEPPLEFVPLEDWYCSRCEERRLIQAAEPTAGPSSAVSAARQTSLRLGVPRTELSRRIMNRRRRAASPSPCMTAAKAKSTARSRTTSTATPRRTYRKKTTGRKKKRVSKKGGTKGRTRRKRKGKGRKSDPNRRRVALQRKASTARGRLVQQLGILPPRPGQIYVGLPQYRPTYTGSSPQSSASASIRNQRHQAGIAPLRIYGNDDLADCLSSEEDEGPVGLARPAAVLRHIGQPMKRPSYGFRDLGPSQLSSSANVLGPILSAQYILHKDKNIHIQRDGTLVPSMSITFDKFGKEVNNDNDSSGYDSFGNQGSPPLSRLGGSGRGIGILTATGGTSTNTGGQVPSSELNTRQAAATGSSETTVTTTSENSSVSSSGLGTSPNHADNGSGNSGDPNGSSSYENYLFRFDVDKGSSSPDKSTTKKSDSKQAEEEDDDDYNIYSDIEEPHIEPNAEEPEPEEFDTLDPLIPDGEPDSDSDMVIDERAAAGPIGPRERESISSGESLTIALPPNAAMLNLYDPERNSENGSPALPEVEPDSPLSIPLPDSTPPPSVSEAQEDSEGLSIGEDQDNEDQDKLHPKEEYDPSHPLTSSDEEEAPVELPKLANRSPAKLAAADSNKLDTTTDPAALSLIPIPPSEEYRRPTIQFSIPSRHRIFSMGSLIKRNKGVTRKEAKSGSSISFQSEMSKAFGTEKEDTEGDDSKQGMENERVSLVAEIFGSDEEDEARRLREIPDVPSTEPVRNNVGNEPSSSVPEVTAEGVSESGKWKKIVKDDVPAPSIPELEDDDVVLIGEEPPEVQIIETPPPEPDDEPRPSTLRRQARRNRETGTQETVVAGKPEETKQSNEKDPSSLDSISEEDTPEFASLKQKLEEVRKESSIRAETVKAGTTFDIMEFDSKATPSKPAKKDKEAKEKKASKRKKSFSGSNCEEGEILEVSDKKRKKGKKSKKSKKNKKSRDSRSISPVDFSEKKLPENSRALASSSSSDEMDGDAKRVPWKKPSKSTKERNYRDGKPKTEEKYFREKERKHDESPSFEIRSQDKSPKSKNRDTDKDKRNKVDNSIASKKQSRSRSKHRSLSRSKGKAKRTRSRHSGSSSSRSFRSQSRSGYSRSPRTKRDRRPYRRSYSPRRVISRSRSRSRSLRRSYRSKSPAQHRNRSKRRSRSASRDKRNKWKHWSDSSSRSRSRSTSPRGRRKKDKVAPPADEKAKKSKKDTKDKAVVERSALVPAETTKDKSGDKDKDKKKKKKKREKSVSPAKAIFADGDSIVVSLNFQSKTKEAGTNGKESGALPAAKADAESSDRKKKGSKSQSKGVGKSKPLKKTILIDLETSPIQEQNIGVSPTLIVLSDDDDMRDYTSSSSKSKGNSTERDGLNVSTTSGNGHDSSKSPSYRDGHGVPADSTQLPLQQLYQNEGGLMNESSGFFRRTSSSPDKFSNATPTRGDSLVTSTRDSMEGNTTLHDDYTLSPFSPPKEADSSPLPSTPPLPPGTPPRMDSSLSGPSPNSGGLRQLGIGNIPGLFVSSSLLAAPNGGILAASPVVIPTPPIPQLRMPPPVATNLFNQSVLATVANALYGPLLGTPNRISAQGSGQNVSSSVPSRTGPSVIQGKKYGGAQMGGTVLLPKDQNSHTQGHGRRGGEGGGDSPFSPNSSDGDDLFEPPTDGQSQAVGTSQVGASKGDKGTSGPNSSGDSGGAKGKPKGNIYESIFGGPVKKTSAPQQKKPDKNPLKGRLGRHMKSKGMKKGTKKEIPKLSEQELRMTGDVPTSAVDLRVKEKFLKKLNRQERVVEEVKLSLKPHYIKKHITKDEYKEILRKAVPKICHNKHGDINPLKIKELIEAYVKKFRHARKK